ncbi:DUF2442 domain-containing protein [Desulfobotulus mexicanus]|uniref:DUF2442 domain-containing protein n=1 Tax=Desulfobotulus mexicanus TaxID=2586642 RepID=A0A5Q4VIM0_9BACT|nr:DUF2442 domain-containing protein [Desulfobotulus mexicanus]TYT75831.1 DUF2442 domain-containing protein [Desulfobotulus mexicanus]
MNLSAHGSSTFPVEVTHISTHGIWILAHGCELFMPYSDFPWFKDQRLSDILSVVELSPGHFYWPNLDIDLTQEIIENPQRFPNISI